MLIGYARVSTIEQNLDLQIDALKKAGCEKIFQDTASGAIKERKALEEALAYLRPGDTLVVWRLDRLGRSVKNLIELINSLKEKNIGLKHHRGDRYNNSNRPILFPYYCCFR